MEAVDSKKSEFLSSLNITDSFMPRLWINDYFCLLVNEIDILTETVLIESQSSAAQIKIANDKRDSILDRINDCEQNNLKNFERFTDQHKHYLKDQYECIFQTIKKNCFAEDESLINEEKNTLIEKLVKNEAEFEMKLFTLLSSVFSTFCFFVKESQISNSEDISKSHVKFLFITDFYLSQIDLK